MNRRWSVLIVMVALIFHACKEAPTDASQEKAVEEQVAAKSEPIEGDYISENGLFIEQFDANEKDDNKYSADNKIYKPGQIFVYDYIYYNQENQDRLCTILDAGGKIPGNKSWYFAPPKDMAESTITEIHITIIYGLGVLKKLRPDYNKTVAKYNYAYPKEMSTFREQAGIVENEKNIWMTPPRFRIFRMLELNPYPFIQAPYEVGNKWTWEKEIQQRWGDVQWVKWNGNLKNSYSYEITDKKRMDTAFGELECLEIKGTANNEMGTASLTSYFHPTYGFVRLDYTNIQGTRMVLNLKAINQYVRPESAEGDN